MANDSWIAEGLVFVTGGKGFAIAPDGGTICLGTEERISKVLAGEKDITLLEAEKKTFQRIKELIRMVKNGTARQSDKFKAQRVSHFRNRPTRGFEHRAKHIKRTSVGKKFPGHKVKQQKSGLPD